VEVVDETEGTLQISLLKTDEDPKGVIPKGSGHKLIFVFRGVLNGIKGGREGR